MTRFACLRNTAQWKYSVKAVALCCVS